MRKMSKISKTLNLKEFMLRQEVLQLYRQIIRTISKVPDPATKLELIAWARNDFHSNKHITDPLHIRTLMENGRKSFKELQGSLHLSGYVIENKK